MKKQSKLDDLLQIVSEKPDTKDICAILQKMTKEEFDTGTGQSLNEAISNYEDKRILFLILPIVVEIASTNADLNLLGYLTFLKYNCDIRDPSTLSLESLKNYLNGLEQMSGRIGNGNTPKNAKKMGMSMSDAYFIVRWGYVLRTFGRDAIAFYRHDDFQEAFHVKCQHCGNDIHSLLLGESNITHLEELENSLPNKNLIWRADAMENLELNYLVQQLFHLYGTYTCSQCGGENTPIKAAADYILAEFGEVTWTVEKVQELERKLLEKYDYSQDAWWEKLVFYGNYIAQLYWDVDGADSLRPYDQLLRISSSVRTFYSGDYVRYMVNQCVQILEKAESTHGSDLDLVANLYTRCRISLVSTYDVPEEDSLLAASYGKKADEILSDLYGMESRQAVDARQSWAGVYLQFSWKSGLKEPKYAQELLELMRQNSEFSKEEVEKYQEFIDSWLVPDGHRDFAKEIQDKLEEIDETIQEYGDNTDIVADYRGDLGELYIESGEPEKGLEHLEFALKIHTGELGKEYLLPPFLRNTIHKGKKLVGQAEDTSAFMMRVLSVSGALGQLSQYYVSSKEFKTAIKLQEQGLELWKWAGQVDTVEIADKLRILAEIYQKMGKKTEFEDNFGEAKRIYLHCIENSPYESEVSESEEGLEALELLKQ